FETGSRRGDRGEHDHPDGRPPRRLPWGPWNRATQPETNSGEHAEAPAGARRGSPDRPTAGRSPRRSPSRSRPGAEATGHRPGQGGPCQRSVASNLGGLGRRAGKSVTGGSVRDAADGTFETFTTVRDGTA